MSAALEVALRALRHRDRSAADVVRYLESRGVDEPERHEVVETLIRTALVDDRRYASARATSLAGRGAGDELIRVELANAGVDGELVEEAVAGLPAELERATDIVARRGSSPTTARYLGRKGFSADVVHRAVAPAGGEPLG